MFSSDVRSYVCEDCAHVLKFSKPENYELFQITCPLCYLEWAVQKNTWEDTCFCCGIQVSISNNKAIAKQPNDACGACKQPLNSSQYFCPKCGSLHRKFEEPPMVKRYISTVETRQDNMNEITLMANSGLGFLIRAAWRLKDNQAELDEKWMSYFDSPDPLSGFGLRHSFMDASLRCSKQEIEYLRKAISLDKRLAPAVADILPSFADTIAHILNSYLDWAIGDFVEIIPNLEEVRKYWTNYPKEHNSLVEELRKYNQTQVAAIPVPFILLSITKTYTVGQQVVNNVKISNLKELHTWVTKQLNSSRDRRIRIPPTALSILNQKFLVATQA